MMVYAGYILGMGKQWLASCVPVHGGFAWTQYRADSEFICFNRQAAAISEMQAYKRSKNPGRLQQKFSEICLGYMARGGRNTKSEACRQLDFAIDRDAGFVDSAEFCSLPPRAETLGVIECCLGSGLKVRGGRAGPVIEKSEEVRKRWPDPASSGFAKQR